MTMMTTQSGKVALVAGEIREAHARWERGEDASPDSRDLVIYAERTLGAEAPDADALAETLWGRACDGWDEGMLAGLLVHAISPPDSPERDDLEEPVHRPPAPDAPIPGEHHYSACDPDRPRVSPLGVCRGCGSRACPKCGKGDCGGGEGCEGGD